METNFDSLLNVSAVPQNDRTAAFIAESRENRSRCYEMSEQMTSALTSDGQTFQQYLDMQSHFDRYTANNVLLIMAQKPDAQKIGDYGYWRDQGVYVKRQERKNPILIMEPGKEYEREDGSVGTYYNAKKLYDISQTNMGDKLRGQDGQTQGEARQRETGETREGKADAGQEKPEQTAMKERQLIRALVSCPPAAIITAEDDQMPEDKGALFDPEDGCIYVRKGMDAQEIFRSLAPELALAGFADGDKNYDRDGDAFHAYCASYILCKKYGVDTKDFDFSEAPEMFDGMESQEVRGELSRIREAANNISSRMAKVLDQNRNQNQRTQPPQNREEAR